MVLNCTSSYLKHESAFEKGEIPEDEEWLQKVQGGSSVSGRSLHISSLPVQCAMCVQGKIVQACPLANVNLKFVAKSPPLQNLLRSVLAQNARGAV